LASTTDLSIKGITECIIDSILHPEFNCDASRSRRPYYVEEIAEDAHDVLVKCRQLRDNLRAKAADKQVKAAPPPNIPDKIVEVDELPTEVVLQGIEAVALGIAQQLLNKRGFCMEFPSRSALNQVYAKE
jgi:hypothetical protein